MLNALIYHVASGQAFFSGVALIHLALLLSLGPGNQWRSISRSVAAFAGLLLIAASATPLPLWFYAVAVTVTLAWAADAGASGARSPLRRLGWAAVLLAWWTGMAMELPYHKMPRLPGLGHPTLFVVGDSITAGMGGEVETWPKILTRRHGVDVRDLSLPGATVEKARKQAESVTGSSSLVLAEIGGNDILGDTQASAFETSLDAVLSRLRAGKNSVVLMELPLPPSYNRFGEIQRRLARRHGAFLVPKRVLLKVLETDGATLDSIHLSRAGHALMAETIWNTIRPAYR